MAISIVNQRKKKKKICLYQIPQHIGAKMAFSIVNQHKNMPLSDSPAHRCQDGVSNCQSRPQLLSKKHDFIRFPSPSEPRWNFSIVNQHRKKCLYQIP